MVRVRSTLRFESIVFLAALQLPSPPTDCWLAKAVINFETGIDTFHLSLTNASEVSAHISDQANQFDGA